MVLWEWAGRKERLGWCCGNEREGREDLDGVVGMSGKKGKAWMVLWEWAGRKVLWPLLFCRLLPPFCRPFFGFYSPLPLLPSSFSFLP